MIVVLKGFIWEFDIGIGNIAILRADNPSQYQLSSQTGACSARHSLRPQTKSLHIVQFEVVSLLFAVGRFDNDCSMV